MSVILYKIDSAKNLYRFYSLYIQQDLFGNYCLIRAWGRIGISRQQKIIAFTTLEAAEKEMQKQQRIRTKKGYKP